MKHYKGGEVPAALKAAAELAPLHSTLAQAAVKHGICHLHIKVGFDTRFGDKK